jgi:hypothetical protein
MAVWMGEDLRDWVADCVVCRSEWREVYRSQSKGESAAGDGDHAGLLLDAGGVGLGLEVVGLAFGGRRRGSRGGQGKVVLVGVVNKVSNSRHRESIPSSDGTPSCIVCRGKCTVKCRDVLDHERVSKVIAEKHVREAVVAGCCFTTSRVATPSESIDVAHCEHHFRLRPQSELLPKLDPWRRCANR